MRITCSRWTRRGFNTLIGIGVVFLSTHAFATVVQVDGTIVPVIIYPSNTCSEGGNIQRCISDEEGYSPPNAYAIDAIIDAAMVPEVFIPRTTSTVTFKDVAEGAGFENSFGYYNVGDDVTDTDNLHPILGCGVSAASHPYEAAGYVVNAEAGSIATVNFATEASAGRYKGGFIGFYLITPQLKDGTQNRGNPNCGDFVSSQSYHDGYTYYTQRDLNNDGDFVHHLVYSSRNPAYTDRFYFGFEDLFRGGDNDFEDMLIQVTGLTPPCTPKAEVCDGLDNDCDGATDESTVDTGSSCICNDTNCVGGARQGICQMGVTVCVSPSIRCQSTVSPGAESCNNLDDDCDGSVDESITQSCYSGPSATLGVGACTAGQQTCVTGNWGQCTGDVTPTSETCNGVDDDCNGVVDNSPIDVGVLCDSSLDTDLCPEGYTSCQSGSLVCDDSTGDTLEYCNGVDDDCDGVVDNHLVDIGQSCTAGIGRCIALGVTVCSGGVPVCNATPGTPITETCNGVDDNCDGAIDEGLSDLGPCGTNTGECSEGRLSCIGGAVTCQGGIVAQPETCNSKDDDCDGAIDEGLNNLGTCGIDTGECTQGQLSCIGGKPTCQGGIGPLPEQCNGKDDDCDGAIDERTGDPGDTNNSGLTDEGTPCGDDLGECESGSEQCVSGSLQCVGGKGPVSEICNALDDDCDGTPDDNPIDVGEDNCGVSDVGECELGKTICLVGGQIGCNGNIDPTFEVCNGKDDDCNGTTDDNPVDVGQVCGSSQGTCSPGKIECVNGKRECAGVTGGTVEVCNGIDDDCNNIIDDNVTDEGKECGEAEGVCEKGHEQCVDGKLQCIGVVLPGTEVCNCFDDDCDSLTDEGDLCSGGVCVDCRCSLPCTKSVEFTSCPTAQTCVNDYCVPDDCYQVNCAPEADGTATTCDKGKCVPLCDTIACEEPNVCRHTDGACVGNNCLFLPYLCLAEQRCVAGECKDDLCKDVSCNKGQFCREGECVDTCIGVTCAGTEVCRDGKCVSTGCKSSCGSGEVCDTTSQTCVADLCKDASPCGQDKVCNPETGACVVDPCATIVCPEGSSCDDGQCVSSNGGSGGSSGTDKDAGPPADYVLATGGHCSVVAPGGSDRHGALWLALCLLALALGRYRWRKARFGALTAMTATGSLAVLLLGGCAVEPYCLGNCPDSSTGQQGRPDGSIMGEGGTIQEGDASADGNSNEAGQCVPTRTEDDLCNGIDDDCDGMTDENFDLTISPENCGKCGHACQLEGARAFCDQSQCRFMDCFPGYVDLNGDTSGPYESTDGCEYPCFTSNDGVEACDGLDNDCDGQTDEATDFKSDINNCGKCGRTCKFFHAIGHCGDGTCKFDTMNDCDPGWMDINSVQFDGCEMQCVKTNEGVELCDGLDNDCDGQVDEDYDLQNSVDYCGKCGHKCEFQFATPHCNAAQCEFDPLKDCTAGYVDDNGNQLDGCELKCTETNDGVEICDGLDNDCNGIVDGVTTDSGAACNAAPGGSAVGACADNGVITCVTTDQPSDGGTGRVGTLVCVGATKAKPETCDNKDNDCDGATDESPVDVGRVCVAPVGECSAGFSVCNAGGHLDCIRAQGPSAERCDGVDNDCDATTDNDPQDTEIGQSCGSSTGACRPGGLACANGGLVCQGGTAPSVETCNNVDDDCDGTTDENALGVGQSCGSDVGVCVHGFYLCNNGTLECNGNIPPGGEDCDGDDDDCDGVIDEDTAGNPLTRSCYSGPAGTLDVGTCEAGHQTCTAGQFDVLCVGDVTPASETCNNLDDDCDGTTDEALSLPGCYTGPLSTRNIGICHDGAQACAAGQWDVCTGDQLPIAEVCDGADNDCDGVTDENASGQPLTQSCYTGTTGTAGVGTCTTGTQTCNFGSWGSTCSGQVLPGVDICGDNLDTDCDGNNDSQENCPTVDSEIKINGIDASDTAGAFHSYDIDVAVAGATLGRNVYMVWSDKTYTEADVFLARSTDGGVTFNTPQNLTSGVSDAAVKPRVVAARDDTVSNDRVYVTYQRVNGGVRQLYVLRSSNSGSSFSSSTLANTSGTDNFKHDIAVSANGQNIAIVWEQLNTSTLVRDVYARSSSNSGSNWNTATRINNGSWHLAGKPKVVITASGRRVFAWREARSPRTTFDIYATYGTHAELIGGNTVSNRGTRLDSDTGDTRQSDDLVMATAGADTNAGGTNNVYVAWNDLSTTVSGDADVIFVRSNDDGGTWSAERIIDDPSSEVSRSYPPVIAVDPNVAATTTDDRIFLAWPDRREGSQIYASRSVDSGQTFAAAQRASNNSGLPISTVASDPRIVYAGGNLVVIAYVQTDSSEVSHIYAARSIDAAANWSYTDPPLDNAGNYDAMAPVIGRINATGHDNGAIIAWVDFRSGTHVNADIYTAHVWQ